MMESFSDKLIGDPLQLQNHLLAYNGKRYVSLNVLPDEIFPSAHAKQHKKEHIKRILKPYCKILSQS